MIVTDRNNQSLRDRGQDGGACSPGSSAGRSIRNNCDMLATGNVLIAIRCRFHPRGDREEGNRVAVLEQERSSALAADRIVWATGHIDHRLQNSRVIEVTPEGKIAWTFRVPYLANSTTRISWRRATSW